MGIWFDGCRRQQPIPQHRPSGVPQQQVLRKAFDSLPGPSDCAETGVQITATLVLRASSATMKTRMGFGWWYIVVESTARLGKSLHRILQPPVVDGNKPFPSRKV